MELKAYGDESHDETKSRVFAVAALIGPEDVWQAAENAWIIVNEGRAFHAAECESEFAHHPDRSLHKQNQARYATLSQILARSGLAGIGVGIDLGAYNEVFPGVPGEFAYLKCLLDSHRGHSTAHLP